jgi:hypothetical protein
MDHVDLHLYQIILQNQYPFLNKSILRKALEEYLDYPITLHDVNTIYLTNKPTTQHIVHGLKNKGYSPGFIAQLLQINPSSVSYHLARPIKRPYVNAFIRALENKKAELNRY